jgi:hypothetical protein
VSVSAEELREAAAGLYTFAEAYCCAGPRMREIMFRAVELMERAAAEGVLDSVSEGD